MNHHLASRMTLVIIAANSSAEDNHGCAPKKCRTLFIHGFNTDI